MQDFVFLKIPGAPHGGRGDIFSPTTPVPTRQMLAPPLPL